MSSAFRRYAWLSLLAVIASLVLTTPATPSRPAQGSPPPYRGAGSPTGTVHDVYAGQSVAAAVDAASGGDTIVLHAGTYTEVDLTKDFATPVMIAGAPGESVTVGGFSISGAAGYRISGLRTNGGSVVFNGSHDISFTHVDCTLPADLGNTTSCFYLHDSSYNLTIARSVIRGGWVGVHIYSSSAGPGPGWVHNVTIANNDISGAAIDDIHLDGVAGAVIAHNFIHDPQANTEHNDGIQSQASDNLSIVRNTFSFTTVPGGVNVGTAIILGNLPAQFPDRKVTNTYIANNLVAHWLPGRAIILSGTENTQIVNNTLVDNGTAIPNSASIIIANQGATGGQNSGVSIWNNILRAVSYDPGSIPPVFFDTNLFTRPGAGARGSHAILANPRFLNRVSYALAAKSRARGRGITPPGTPRVDIDGRRRTFPPDLGARS